MKHAYYHQAGKPALKLEILNEREDGTVDLGFGGKVKISECVITEEAEPGSCTLPSDAELKGEAKAAARELRQRATALGKAAGAAVKAAKDAEGKPEHAKLLEAAEEAKLAAKQADEDADLAEKAAK